MMTYCTYFTVYDEVAFFSTSEISVPIQISAFLPFFRRKG